MERVQVELDAPGFDRPGTVIRYGHWGRPVLVFPSEQGRAWDYENNGMVDAVRPLIDEGRVKLYCVDSFDHATWSDDSDPARGAGPTARAIRRVDHRRGGARGSREDSPGAAEAVVDRLQHGCLPRAPTSRSPARTCSRWRSACPAATTPPQWHAWGERGEAAYFTNPHRLRRPTCRGRHLDWLRGRVHVVLTVRPGTLGGPPHRSLPEAHRMAGLLAERGIPHELDVWGHDCRARLGLVAASARRPPATLLLTAPGGPMSDHLIGLLLGAEEDWPQAFEAILRRRRPAGRSRADRTPSTASGSPSSRSTCATRCAASWSSTGSRTGTTTRGSG